MLQAPSFASPLGEAQIFLKIWVRDQCSRPKPNHSMPNPVIPNLLNAYSRSDTRGGSRIEDAPRAQDLLQIEDGADLMRSRVFPHGWPGMTALLAPRLSNFKQTRRAALDRLGDQASLGDGRSRGRCLQVAFTPLQTDPPRPCPRRRTWYRRHILRLGVFLRSTHGQPSARRTCHKDGRQKLRRH